MYEAFGLNPCLLGCVLCLSNGIKNKAAAKTANSKGIFRNLRAFYAEANRARGEEKDRAFAPGPRVISEDCPYALSQRVLVAHVMRLAFAAFVWQF